MSILNRVNNTILPDHTGELSAFLILLFLPMLVLSQPAEPRFMVIQGKVIDQERQAVAFAHILVESRHVGCVANNYGKFELGVYGGDTLTISAVSYHKKYFIVPDSLSESSYPLKFLMEADTILLPEQTVYAWPESEAFKKLTEVRIEDLEKSKSLLVPSTRDLIRQTHVIGGEGSIGVAFPGPFSLFYSAFSKEAKTRKALEKIILAEKLNKRYNPELVSLITGFDDRLTINRFLMKCKLSPQFILNSNDYELYYAVLKCYREFSSEE